MKQFLLFTLLAGATHAFLPPAETKCIVTQTPFLCLPILGESVYIQLMCNASGYMVRCDKSTTKIFGLKKGIVNIDQDYRNRAEFFISNGTLKITDMKKSDSGAYSVQIHRSDGSHVKNFSFDLKVKDNIYNILFICIIVLGALLLILCCCCILREMKCCQRSDKNEELKNCQSLDLNEAGGSPGN